VTLARRLPLVLAILTLGVGGGATAWLTGAEASTLPAVREAPPGLQPNGVTEAVKANETGFDQTFCMSASCGSLIHATVGSAGGIGRPANREGLAV